MKKCLLVCVLLVVCGCNKNLKTERKMSDLSENLIAHYKMDDNAASTVVLDSSGNDNHGTSQQNTSAMHATGKVDGALGFNGSTDYITITNNCNPGTNSLSISFWLKISQLPSDYKASIISNLLERVEPPAKGFSVALNSSGGLEVVWFGDVGEGPDTIVSGLELNVWYHIVASINRTDGNIYGYKDGLQTFVVDFPLNFGSLDGTNPLLLGYPNTPDDTDYFAGVLDDIRIYNKALSASEVCQLYSEVVPSNNRGTIYTSDNNSIYGTDSNSIFGE